MVIRAFYISQYRQHVPFRSDMAATSAPLGANFGQEGSNLGPTSTHLLKMHHVRVHHMASIWGPSAPIWTQLQLNDSLGANLGSSWVQDSATWAQPGPISRIQCDTLKTCMYSYFQRFLALMGARARPCCPRRACLGPNFRSRCLHTGPSCAR